MIFVSISALMRHIITLIIASPAGFADVTPSVEKELKPFSQIKQLKSDFRQIRKVTQWQTEIETQGSMSIENGPNPKIIWEVKKPTYSAIQLVRSILHMRNDQTGKWTPLKNKKAQQSMAQVFTWLRFDFAAIKKDFSIEKVKDGQFRFLPKKKKTHFSKIEIFFEKAPRLKKIVLHEKNNDFISIHFSNTQVR